MTFYTTDEKTFLKPCDGGDTNTYAFGVTAEGIGDMGGEITYFEWCCGIGHLAKGQTMACIESTKAAVELHAPCDLDVVFLGSMEPFTSDKVEGGRTLAYVVADEDDVKASCVEAEA